MPAIVLWPEREGLYELMLLRASVGPAAFNSEKQNNPIDPNLSEWPEEFFTRPGFWFDQWPLGLTVKTIGLDPSKGGESKHHDYQARVKLGRDANKILYVEAYLQKEHVDIMVEGLVEEAIEFQPDRVAIETNQFQQLLVVPVLKAARDRNYMIPTQEMINTANKRIRILRIGPYLAQRNIRFKANSPGTRILVEQLRDFPQGEHDDGPDALEMAIRAAVSVVNERMEPKPRRLRV